jgi:hypothetical protein
MYAKLIDGNLEFAPQNKGAVINYNVNVELMVKDGYKEFFPVPRPEQTNRKYHIEYVEGKNSIEEMIVFDETQEEADEREAREKEEEFNRQFFLTSLGYVRRTVTMKDDSKKSFLTDILPMLVEGVPVLVYTRELEQSKVLVTTDFINECKQQLLKDFYGEE